MEQGVTLVLGEDRLEAIRDNLISKSQYFASLFSPNFKDSQNSEHYINYDIETKTLQTFIDWTSDNQNSTDNESDYRHIKPSLARYDESSADFDDLVQLLQLSVLFAAETLIKDLTDLIAHRWLTPEKSIQLWLLAKELNLETLRDLALVTCMDRLSEVPESLILELPAKEFISLIGNVHAQADPDLLYSLVVHWELRNIPRGENNAYGLHYPFTLSAEHLNQPRYTDQFEEQRLKNNLQCVVGHKLAEDDTKKACIYCWDGSTFSELVEIRTFSPLFSKNIVGRQVVARGFDVYIVGGEYGMGTGRFEKDIWRYSTVSKTWYYVTSLREPRRHMAVAFLNEKLFVIGGVGRHRLKLSTVEVYNIYTGEWSKAADVPEDFTSVPPVFQIGGSLAFYKSALYTYNMNSSSWLSSGLQFSQAPSFQRLIPRNGISVQFLMARDCDVYIVDSSNPNHARIWVVKDNSDQSPLRLGRCMTQFNNQVMNGPYLVGFSYRDEKAFVEVLKFSLKGLKTQLVHSETISNLRDLCLDFPIGCFNISNWNTLQETFNDQCT